MKISKTVVAAGSGVGILSVMVFSSLFLSTGSAWAAGDSGVRFLPGGIIAPGFNQSIIINPAALPDGAAPVAQAEFEPSLLDYPWNTYDASFAAGSKQVGAGIGYYRTDFGSGISTQSIGAGAGIDLKSVSLGLGLLQGVGASSGTTLEAGVLVGQDQGLRFGGVLNNFTSAPAMTLGIGYIQPKTYNLEFNLGFPSFSSGLVTNGSIYTLLFNASVYANEVFGLGFTLNYLTPWGSLGSGTWGYEVAALIHPMKWPAFTVRLTSFKSVIFGVAFEF